MSSETGVSASASTIENTLKPDVVNEIFCVSVGFTVAIFTPFSYISYFLII